VPRVEERPPERRHRLKHGDTQPVTVEQIIGSEDFIVHELTHARQRQLLREHGGWYTAISEAAPNYLGVEVPPSLWPKSLRSLVEAGDCRRRVLSVNISWCAMSPERQWILSIARTFDADDSDQEALAKFFLVEVLAIVDATGIDRAVSIRDGCNMLGLTPDGLAELAVKRARERARNMLRSCDELNVPVEEYLEALTVPDKH
jgi:hypothetical protein